MSRCHRTILSFVPQYLPSGTGSHAKVISSKKNANGTKTTCCSAEKDNTFVHVTQLGLVRRAFAIAAAPIKLQGIPKHTLPCLTFCRVQTGFSCFAVAAFSFDAPVQLATRVFRTCLDRNFVRRSHTRPRSLPSLWEF